MDKFFYRVPEVCDRLSMGRSRVYELIASGELRSVKVGASRLVPAAALAEFADRIAAPNDAA